MKACRMNGGIAPIVLNLRSKREWAAWRISHLIRWERIPVPYEQGAGWAAELVWVCQEYNNLYLLGIELLSVQPVV